MGGSFTLYSCMELLYIFGGFLVFSIINVFLMYITPKSAQETAKQSWKWKNIMNSLIHSIIASIWALASFYWYPKMAEDLINFYSFSPHLLVAFSVGYFCFDLFDLMKNHRKRSSFELLVHHTFVITCCGLAVVTRKYIGYSVVALLVEVNSIFLHLRQILIIVGVPKSDSMYRLNALANIATYIVFRVAVLGWMTRWLVLHKDHLSLPIYTLGSVGLAVIVVMNIVLFFRVCIVDFSSKVRSEGKIVADISLDQPVAETAEIRGGHHSSNGAASSSAFFNNTCKHFHVE